MPACNRAHGRYTRLYACKRCTIQRNVSCMVDRSLTTAACTLLAMSHVQTMTKTGSNQRGCYRVKAMHALQVNSFLIWVHRHAYKRARDRVRLACMIILNNNRDFRRLCVRQWLLQPKTQGRSGNFQSSLNPVPDSVRQRRAESAVLTRIRVHVCCVPHCFFLLLLLVT